MLCGKNVKLYVKMYSKSDSGVVSTYLCKKQRCCLSVTGLDSFILLESCCGGTSSLFGPHGFDFSRGCSTFFAVQ